MIRKDLDDLIFRTERGKYQAVIREIKARHEKGQPVLVGTVSIEKNEKLSRLLQAEGIPHEILNAKNHEREALIIAQAGRKGAVTIATNMAGRGVDIILGGTPFKEIPNPKSQIPNKSEIQNSKFQTDVYDEGREVRDLGGLHVIGTERHEARRIDNQLRGRAGRQGDPGSSQFFVSMEDELMRVFGSARIKNMMETFGIPEDQPIESKIVSRAIEEAQRKIEGFHFDSRKHLLEYDDVLNKQREAIYKMRREVLFADQIPNPKSQISNPSQIQNSKSQTLRERIFEMLEEEITKLVEFHTTSDSVEEWNIEEIFETVKAMAEVPDEVHQKLRELIFGSPSSESSAPRAPRLESPEEKRSKMVRYLLDELQKIYAEREARLGAEGARNIERAVMLRSIDMLWMDHLNQMEHLRDSVRLRAYGQRDPLVEYKHEGARLYRELQAVIRAQIVNSIFKVGAAPKVEHPSPQKIEFKKPGIVSMPGELGDQRGISGASPQTSPGSASVKRFIKKEPGRNDPCPCGSGKKYKKCHGA